MKTFLLALLLWAFCALPAAAATLEILTWYFSPQYFTWQERDNGRRLLKESGPLFSLGGAAGIVADSSFTIRGKGELFGGQVGYQGETQPPDPQPIRTDVAYFGTREEVDLGYRVSRGRGYLEPFAGLGHRWWLRELQDTSTAAGSAVKGYTELWQTAYGRLGARGELALSSGGAAFAEGGAKYPFYTGNSVDFVNGGVITFHPGAAWSGFAETGIRVGSLKLALSYEGFRFSASSPKRVQGTRYLQPESSSDIFGASLGWSF
uniref:Uncharacterized protein n=1 Tax=Geobacter sp. (strain M21) TaxID=443144 RepID=C6E0U7_GEOSM